MEDSSLIVGPSPLPFNLGECRFLVLYRGQGTVTFSIGNWAARACCSLQKSFLGPQNTRALIPEDTPKMDPQLVKQSASRSCFSFEYYMSDIFTFT